jgi:hypothetical protein
MANLKRIVSILFHLLGPFFYWVVGSSATNGEEGTVGTVFDAAACSIGDATLGSRTSWRQLGQITLLVNHSSIQPL